MSTAIAAPESVKTTRSEAASLPPEIRSQRHDQLVKASAIIRKTSKQIDDEAAARSCLWLARNLQDVASIYVEGGAA
jgi:hypothetical protein